MLWRNQGLVRGRCGEDSGSDVGGGGCIVAAEEVRCKVGSEIKRGRFSILNEAARLVRGKFSVDRMGPVSEK